MKHVLLSTVFFMAADIAQAQSPTAPPAAHYEAGSAQHGNEAMHHSKPPVPPSSSLTVTYAGKSTNFTPSDLAAMPQVTVHVHNAHANADETYAGPLLSDVLAKAGFSVSHETEPIVLHSALLASATDGYLVLFSLAEVEPSFSKSQVIVALTKGGQPDTAGGFIQLINTDGVKPARWVHGLSGIRVVALQPGQ